MAAIGVPEWDLASNTPQNKRIDHAGLCGFGRRHDPANDSAENDRGHAEGRKRPPDRSPELCAGRARFTLSS
jgi:hypothetical protein